MLKTPTYNKIPNMCRFISYNKNINVNKVYSHTVFTPKSKMPIKRSFELEQKIAEEHSFTSLYDIQKKSGKDEFVLHDGPPYANGLLHLGHILNKTLKDVICRYKIKEGYKVHYKPGWDCHGLPIELKVKQNMSNYQRSAIIIREKARVIAEKAIKDQFETFKKLGIIGDWNNPYLTFTPEYAIQELKAFYSLLNKKLIFRDFLPVYWSPENKTSLANSELEYNENHLGYSLYFRFQVFNLPIYIYEKVYALIWTTTPWTLPANQAIVFSPSLNYSIARISSGEHYIIAQELIPELQKMLGTTFVTKFSLNSKLISELKYLHPMKPEKFLPFISDNFVTAEKGTGLVHSAPNHGFDDFYSSMKKNIKVECCIVDDEGKFNSNAHEDLQGKFVLNEGSEAVIKMLAKDVVLQTSLTQNYPYDWRSKKPIIIKTSTQWFIDIKSISQECLNLLDEVRFYPNGIKNQIKNEIISRPPWCISRQRVWGIPIPVFYASDDLLKKNAIYSRESIDHIIKLIKTYGTNVWWEMSCEQLLPKSMIEFDKRLKNGFSKGEDIFDVWLDSGLSWNYALTGEKVADMYLEGLDQAHGWFQASLICSTALRSKAPYKSVYVHGFAVDSKGNKMSKSSGNYIEPCEILNEFGADVLRYYVCKYGAHHHNLHFDKIKLKKSSENVFKIRNTLRFCLGCLEDFSTHKIVNYEHLYFLDKYMLHLLFNFCQESKNYYQEYKFNFLVRNGMDFVENQISYFYFPLIKDRLYCDFLESPSRLSSQTTIFYIIRILENFFGPILPLTFAEFKSFLSEELNYDNLRLFENPSSWNNEEIFQAFELIRKIKTIINENTERTKHYGKPYEAIICLTDEDLKLLETIHFDDQNSELVNALQLSRVNLVSKMPNINEAIKLCDDNGIFKILLKPTTLFFCSRCRRYSAVKENGLCKRCQDFINTL